MSSIQFDQSSNIREMLRTNQSNACPHSASRSTFQPEIDCSTSSDLTCFAEKTPRQYHQEKPHLQKQKTLLNQKMALTKWLRGKDFQPIFRSFFNRQRDNSKGS